MKTQKFIFISGGVISGLGKGIASASIGMLLKNKGYSVNFIKCDPYLNVDAGTMNPLEHGEVFVTKDGYEMDMDAGHYERFANIELTRDSGMTSGQVYLSVINKERSLEYDGKCVDPVPYLVNEIIQKIEEFAKKSNVDFILIEMGGTVGEYQNEIYFEAERMMKRKYDGSITHIHLVYLPIPHNLGEMKTKPAQQSVRILNGMGIFPDLILARSETHLDKQRIGKLALGCGIPEDFVFSAPDVSNIYEIPINFDKEGIVERILSRYKVKPNTTESNKLKKWNIALRKAKNAKRKIKIGIVGKYIASGDFNLEDAYASVLESIKHASWYYDVSPEIVWVDSEKFEEEKQLNNINCLIVPGGFGSRGVEGKIKAIKYARENRVPYLGLCYGMQLAVIEFARNVCNIENATSSEIDKNAKDPIIHIMTDQEKKILNRDYGASMRLGNWNCKIIDKKSNAYDVYKSDIITERHRHRYEFNNNYIDILINHGLKITGTTTDGKLVEIVELDKKVHPYFIGVQFHPEFKSSLINPHPLFLGLIKECI